MAASYPSSVKSFTPIVAGVSYPQATQINQPYEEIEAVEDALINGMAHPALPDATASNRDLGSTAKKWRDVHLSGAVNAASAALTTPLPVASGGTAAATATANTVFAGPTTGAAAAPAFRALVSADLPAAGINAGVYNNTTQALSDGVEAALTFNAEDFDTSTFHDNSTAPTRLTAPSTGVYLVTATCSFDVLATGFRYLRIRKGGTTAVSGRVSMAGVSSSTLDLHVAALVSLTASEYVEIMATVTSNNVSTGHASTRELQNSAQIAKVL